MADQKIASLEPLDEASILDYFHAVRQAVPLMAHVENELKEQRFIIGGYTVAVRASDEYLLEEMTRALVHLRLDQPAPVDLTINLWHGASQPETRPLSPLAWYLKVQTDINEQQIQVSKTDQRRLLAAFNTKCFRTSFYFHPNILQLLDLKENQAHYWIEDLDSRPYFEDGAPFRKIFSWWMSERGRLFVHAAAVGSESGAVLIVGRSGMGKSTTALACLSAGMKYLGDDYCLVDDLPAPHVYSLYQTAKLKERVDLDRFPHLIPMVFNAEHIGREKALLFVNNQYSQNLSNMLPLKAIFVPKVNGKGKTRLTRVAPTEVLAAMAPSTIQQLPESGRPAFRLMAELIKKVPGYLLEIGPEIDTIPETILKFLEKT